MQAAQPWTNILPVQFGLGVMVDHMFGSEELLQILSRLGFCVSYDEVVRFKQSVMQAHTGFSAEPRNLSGAFTQFIADNVDHNVCTLDGKGTFHGMGMISATVEATEPTVHHITRIPKRMKAGKGSHGNSVTLLPYSMGSGVGLSRIELADIRSLQHPLVLPCSMKYNSLWLAGNMLSTDEYPGPNWSGYMTTACTGAHPCVTSVNMLPIIDLSPMDETCIYSTLSFLTAQSEKTSGSAMAEGPRDALVSRNSGSKFCNYKISLSYGIICVILRLAVFTQYQSVTDTHTETDGQIHDDGMYCASIASRGKNRPYCTRPTKYNYYAGNERWLIAKCTVIITYLNDNA